MLNRAGRILASALIIVGLIGVSDVDAVHAQSLTSGAVRGTVVSREGLPLNGVQVSLEQSDGRALTIVETDLDGRFTIPLVQPGEYRILVEDIGYQPVRMIGVPVAAGRTTVVTSRLERKPPPILAVEEIAWAGALAGASSGAVVGGRQLRAFDKRLDISDVAQGVTDVDAVRDSRAGLASGGAGLAPLHSQLYVDGLPETLLRHPGLPGEPASTPLFQREGAALVQVMNLAFDTEWRGHPGTIVAAHTARGGNGFAFRPYGFLSSATLGGAAEDNPADSAGSNILLGASFSGAIIPDTAHFNIRFDYFSERTPSASPWVNDTASLGGNPVSLSQALNDVASSQYGVNLQPWTSPVVRSRVGFSGNGRFDWRIGSNQVLLRFGYAKVTEEQPGLATELSNLSGVTLDANDVSGALSVTSGGAKFANEFRMGFTSSVRDWQGAGLPSTALAGDGVAFGNSAALPGLFSNRAIDISNAFHFPLARHQLKVGASVRLLKEEHTYRYGSDGIFTFGDLDQFDGGTGSYFESVAPTGTLGKPGSTDWGVFIHDTWAVAPEIQVLLGLRYDTQIISTDLPISFNQAWFAATGMYNDSLPEDRSGISPRVGLVWDVQNRGEWILTGGGGLYQGRLDMALMSETIIYDGRTSIRRGVGDYDFWPTRPDNFLVPSVGPRLAMFNTTYKAPRAFKGGAGLTRVWPSGLAFRVNGLYSHTDYVLQRTDLNRVAEPLGTTQEGRAVFGKLVKQGGLVTPQPTSNRRFSDFDLVSGFSPTGFSDYAELTLEFERTIPVGLNFNLAYTFSRTEDNVLGARMMDPADQLNPFADDQAGATWAQGVSDFDVPHRVVAFAEYRGGGRTPLSIGARLRHRSGLPFTPGFRPGVDINGDGAGNNDPASLDGSISGLSTTLSAAGCGVAALNGFLQRNSCREEGLTALDLRFQIGLPARFSDGSNLALVVDAFNVIGSALGVVDRALVLVDPDRPLTSGPSGLVNVPLIANPNFGKLLSRRADPRVIRVGVRMEY